MYIHTRTHTFIRSYIPVSTHTYIHTHIHSDTPTGYEYSRRQAQQGTADRDLADSVRGVPGILLLLSILPTLLL